MIMDEEKRKLTQKQKKGIAIACIVLFVLLSAAICWFIGKPMIKFVSEPEAFRQWIDERGIWGQAAFLGMMILQVFVAVIPGEPLEICAGYAFGMWEGTLLCLIGTVVGSTFVFLFVRKFGVKAVELFFRKEKIQSLKFLQKSAKRDFLVFFIYFIPGTPKDLLCYVVGLTDMKLSTMLLITTIARIPSVITSTIGGNALGVQDYLFAIIAFAGTLIISGIGILIYKRICAVHQNKEMQEEK